MRLGSTMWKTAASLKSFIYLVNPASEGFGTTGSIWLWAGPNGLNWMRETGVKKALFIVNPISYK